MTITTAWNFFLSPTYPEIELFRTDPTGDNYETVVRDINLKVTQSSRCAKEWMCVLGGSETPRSIQTGLWRYTTDVVTSNSICRSIARYLLLFKNALVHFARSHAPTVTVKLASFKVSGREVFDDKHDRVSHWKLKSVLTEYSNKEFSLQTKSLYNGKTYYWLNLRQINTYRNCW